MTLEEFHQTLANEQPPAGITAPLAALWWDAKGDWTRAHTLVDSLETGPGMAVHAYLHRKEGVEWNAEYCTGVLAAISGARSWKMNGRRCCRNCCAAVEDAHHSG